MGRKLPARTVSGISDYKVYYGETKSFFALLANNLPRSLKEIAMIHATHLLRSRIFGKRLLARSGGFPNTDDAVILGAAIAFRELHFSDKQ
jgi:hypothetical protein